jgi:hypothetical protein
MINANLQIDRAKNRKCCPTNSPIRGELIFSYYSLEVFGLAFDAISNSAVRLDRQLLNYRIGGRLLNAHSSSRSLTHMKDVIFWLVDIGHLSPRSIALTQVMYMHCKMMAVARCAARLTYSKKQLHRRSYQARSPIGL